MTKKIIAIWAQDEKGVIGKGDRLPWHLPAELLPKRQTLILTRNSDEVVDGALVFQDVKSVLTWYQSQEKNLYIIGGKQIFQAFEPYLDEIIVTQIHAQVEGDTYFPEEFDLSRFETVASKSYTRDEKNDYDFTIEYRERKEV